MISLTLFTVWAAYAINENYVSLLVANLSCFSGAATIVIVGCQTGWSKRFLAYAAAGITAAIILSLVSLVALISIMALSGVALRAPQIIAIIKSQDVTGVSAATWVLSTLTAAVWLTISISKGAAGAAIANVTALVAGLVLLALLHWRRATTKANAS